MADDKLMRGLGWLSLGLSIPPLLMPSQFGKALGVGDAPRHRATAVIVGVQELAAAAGLLGPGEPGLALVPGRRRPHAHRDAGPGTEEP